MFIKRAFKAEIVYIRDDYITAKQQVSSINFNFIGASNEHKSGTYGN
jgi:hypothetical protein